MTRTAGTPYHPTAGLLISRITRPEAFEDLNRRGLTRAVRAEEGEDLAPSHLEIDARDRLVAAVSA
jgi:hypothetical protein